MISFLAFPNLLDKVPADWVIRTAGETPEELCS